MRKFIIAILLFVTFLVFFFKFVINNLNSYYFEFANNTEREIELNIEYHDTKEGSFSRKIPPFSEIEFKVDRSIGEVVEFTLLDLNNEVKIGYYLTMGGSFFFKTRYRLEYDGEKINTIYEDKVDSWF